MLEFGLYKDVHETLSILRGVLVQPRSLERDHRIMEYMHSICQDRGPEGILFLWSALAKYNDPAFLNHLPDLLLVLSGGTYRKWNRYTEICLGSPLLGLISPPYLDEERYLLRSLLVMRRVLLEVSTEDLPKVLDYLGTDIIQMFLITCLRSSKLKVQNAAWEFALEISVRWKEDG